MTYEVIQADKLDEPVKTVVGIDLGKARGNMAPLIHRNEQIGVALRTKDKTQPVYVSVGHRISLETAVKYVLECTPKYRLPETTRLADKMASYRKK